MKLELAEGLSLPIEAVTEKLAWLGRTGSGKTYGAMKLAELMLAAGAQVGALDPVGVWRALRVPAEKDGTSFEVVVFGGLYGDLPLEATAGELIADLVVDRGLSFVLDVSQFIPSEQQRFVRAFADRFFHRKKAAPSAVHLFLEECQEFIPENPSGLEAQTLGAMQRLWKLGRNFGIGGSLISQRPQEIAKKALNMSGTLFAFQMTGPQERKTIRSWVADHGVSVDIESVLQRLAVGEPHVESPTFLEVSKTVRILPRVTADLSSTPKVGASSAAKRALTPIDIENLKSSMAATIEKAKADDPKELRRLIAQASKDLAVKDQRIKQLEASKGGTAGFANSNEKAKPVLTDADRAVLEKTAAALSERAAAARDTISVADRRLEEQVQQAAAEYLNTVRKVGMDAALHVEQVLDRVGFQKILGKLATVQPAAAPVVQTRAFYAPKRTTEPASPRTPRPPAARGEPSNLPPAKQKILNALAWLGTVGRTDAERQVVAFVAGISSKSSAYENNVSALRTAGLIEYPGANRLRLTAEGAGLAAVPDAALTSADLHAQIENLLAPAQWRIVRAAIDAYPSALAREELAERASVSAASSAFENNVSRMRSLGLIDYPKQGYVIATPILFLEA